MIAFPPDTTELSAWIQAHLIDTKYCKCAGAMRPYCLVDYHDDFNPDMPRCWGWDANNNRCYISDTVPKNLRPTIVRMEYYRAHDTNGPSHFRAVTATLERLLDTRDISKAERSLLISELLTFYQGICFNFEAGPETPEFADARETLAYLRSLQ